MLLTAEIKRQNLMKTATKALVIKEQTIGESDRLITLLSAEHGLIRAFVRRAKSLQKAVRQAQPRFLLTAIFRFTAARTLTRWTMLRRLKFF